MMERQFDDGEANLHATGAGRQRGAQYEWVGVGGRSIEVVLGQPHRVHSNLFSQDHLIKGGVDDLRIALRVVAHGENKGTELHVGLVEWGAGSV